MMGIENGFVIGKDLARLDALYTRGARYLGLTHTGHNDICTSSGLLEELGDKPAPENVGLSAFGETVIRRANALGMMVDVSTHPMPACVMCCAIGGADHRLALLREALPNMRVTSAMSCCAVAAKAASSRSLPTPDS